MPPANLVTYPINITKQAESLEGAIIMVSSVQYLPFCKGIEFILLFYISKYDTISNSKGAKGFGRRYFDVSSPWSHGYK